MKNIFKNIAVVACGAILASSCNFLDEESRGQVFDSYLTTQNGLEGALTGAYRGLNSPWSVGLCNGTYHQLTAGADDMYLPTTDASGTEIDRCGVTNGNGSVGSTWNGLYKVILRNRFIFIKSDLSEVMRRIVLLHEIGHDQLHRRLADEFQEFQIFDMRGNVMEYEANLFAAQIALPDEEILDYIRSGYDAAQIAMAMASDINLVALKVSELSRRGYTFRDVDHRSDFLK